METLTLLIPLFFLVALLYSMAGFGGGSSYLAVLLMLGFPHEAAPQVALLCNLVVVSTGFYLFARKGHFVPRTVLPFLVTSIPFTYLGGSIPVGKKIFSILLAFSLLMAGLRLFFAGRTLQEVRLPTWQQAWKLGLPIGALIGILSGLVGIGGGIFLAPVLFLLRWAEPKQIAASASLFIFLNSVSNLYGQVTKGGWMVDPSWLLPLLLAAFLGGQIGARLGTQRLTPIALTRVTAAIVLSVSVQLFWKVL